LFRLDQNNHWQSLPQDSRFRIAALGFGSVWLSDTAMAQPRILVTGGAAILEFSGRSGFFYATRRN